MKQKVTKRVPAEGGRYLVLLECGHKRYTKSKTVKVLKCEKCEESESE